MWSLSQLDLQFAGSILLAHPPLRGEGLSGFGRGGAMDFTFFPIPFPHRPLQLLIKHGRSDNVTVASLKRNVALKRRLNCKLTTGHFIYVRVYVTTR